MRRKIIQMREDAHKGLKRGDMNRGGQSHYRIVLDDSRLMLAFSYTLASLAAASFLCIVLGQCYAIGVDKHTVALWLFDEEKGDTVKDSSGNGNDGVLNGDLKWAEGKYGFGLEGNGKDGHVVVPDSESLDLTEELTIEMWLYLNNYSTAGANGVTKETSYKVGVYSEKKIEIRMTTTKDVWANVVFYGNTDVPLKSWHHVAATYKASTGEAKGFLDGQEDGTKKFGGTIVPNDSVVWICRGAAPYLDGIIDEVRISSIDRTQEEIKKSMDGFTVVQQLGKLPISWGMLKNSYWSLSF